MKARSVAFFPLSAFLTTTGCSENSANEDAAATSGSGGGSSSSSTQGGAGRDMESDWVELITGSWELPAGGEITSDIHLKVLERDIFIGALRPISPVGTHHNALAVGDLGNIW